MIFLLQPAPDAWSAMRFTCDSRAYLCITLYVSVLQAEILATNWDHLSLLVFNT